MEKSTDTNSVARWRLARKLTLGAIVVAGSLATAVAVSNRLADSPCRHFHQNHQSEVTHYYTYSGIGVEMTREGESFVVRRVFADSPAEGKIFPGAKLLAVDGVQPLDMHGWSQQIRGIAGSSVTLDVGYPCSGPESVVIEREMIRLRY